MDIARAPKTHKRRYVGAGVAAVVALATLTALARLGPADPSVERASLVIDSVQRGDMKREVRGPGTLVPERVRWISAVTSARVERIVAQPGQVVEPDTVLIEMSNPDVQIEALRAEQALSEAQGLLVQYTVELEGDRLTQQGAVASMRAQKATAAQESTATEALVAMQMASSLELIRKHGAADETAERLEVEEARLKLLTRGVKEQLAVQRQQVERLQAIVRFQRDRVASLVVRAGESGVLTELPLQPGQWVDGGTTMAKIVQPGQLKAVLRIPETQARDLAIGQAASIDTRNGIVAGHVVRMDPSAQAGTVAVDVALDGPLPAGARPDLNVDGSVLVEQLKDVIFTGRPTLGREHATVSLFRVDDGGDGASQVQVRLGRVSANAVEIVSGLAPGDQVVLSELRLPDGTTRIRIE